MLHCLLRFFLITTICQCFELDVEDDEDFSQSWMDQLLSNNTKFKRMMRAKKKNINVPGGVPNINTTDNVYDANYTFNDSMWIYSNYSLYSYERNDTSDTLDKTNIRIKYDYTTIYKQIGAPSITRTKIENLITILENIAFMIGRLVIVPKKRGEIKISSCIPGIQLSSFSANTGWDADLIIFPFFDFSLNEDLIAYSKACVLESKFKRPLAGYMRISKNFNDTKLNYVNYYSKAFIHQLFHIMAFDIDLFYMFESIENKTPQLRIFNLTEDVNGDPKLLIATPSIFTEIVYYYNCSDFSGFLMDLDGRHWDDPLLKGELMNKKIGTESVLSLFTLVFLMDSNWYDVNKYSGGLFKYLMGAGCSYKDQGLVTNHRKNICIPQVNFENPDSMDLFQDKKNRYINVCSENFQSKAICDLETYDITPILNETDFLYSDCRFGSQSINSLEKISIDSACFMTINDQLKNDTSSELIPMCLEYVCGPSSTATVIFIIQKTKVVCNPGDQTVTYNNIVSIICPNYYKLCSEDNFCYNIESCIFRTSIYKFIDSDTETLFEAKALDTLLINKNFSNENFESNDTLIPKSYDSVFELYVNDNENSAKINLSIPSSTNGVSFIPILFCLLPIIILFS